MKRKLGINVDCLRGIKTDMETLEIAHKLGFEAFFTGSRDLEEIAALKKRGDELGMDFEFIHAPFAGINEMWMPGMGYLTMFNAMKQTIDHAAACGVPTVITHVSSGWNPPQVNDLGFSRYDDIVLYAKEKGITVAFENLRMLGNLAAMIDRYEKVDNVMYCYDCGHEHCYTKTVSWIDIFTTRLLCTHIHDNPGRPFEDKVKDYDYHWLPFDGTVNYERMMQKLNEYGYKGSLMLEMNINVRPEYKEMGCEAFMKTAFERIKKISEL